MSHIKSSCIFLLGIVAGTLLSLARANAANAAADPLMLAAQAEMQAANRHDLAAFRKCFTADPVILADASSFSYRGQSGLTDFFRHNPLGNNIQIGIKPGAPAVEDRVGDRAYLVVPVNYHATDANGDSFNDPGDWIGVLVREDGVWKIDALDLTPGRS